MTAPLDAWGLTGTPQSLAGGHRNRVLRVGPHVLKSTRRSEAAVAWLLPVLDAAASAGFVVAPPIRSAAGVLVVEGWTCEPFLPGLPSDVAAVGDRIRAFHARARAMPQRPGFAGSQELLVRDQGGDVDLSRMPAPLVRELRAAWAGVAHVPQGVVHGDLGPGNLLCDADGRYGLIDWDEARRDLLIFDTGSGAPRDTATARAAQAWEIACCWQIEPGRARTLARAFLADAPQSKRKGAPKP
ncbi:MAG: phosphotransferase [Pseudomonadota bacterium]